VLYYKFIDSYMYSSAKILKLIRICRSYRQKLTTVYIVLGKSLSVSII